MRDDPSGQIRSKLAGELLRRSPGHQTALERLCARNRPETHHLRSDSEVTRQVRVRGLRRLPGALQRSWIGSKPWIIAFCPSFLQKSRGACIRHPWWEQRTREIDAGLQSLGNLARSPTPHAEGRACGAQQRAGDTPRHVASQNPHADSLFRRVMAN